MSLTYETSGVDYGPLDAFKRACQKEAATTRHVLAALGMREPASVRGESAYLVETDDAFYAHVEEGLGTKNLVADAMAELTGQCHYRAIGIDTVATIVNDLVTTGAAAAVVAMHAAVGDAAWFEDTHRAAELAAGFALGCTAAGAAWGGGETPALGGIVNPSSVVLAGSAFGVIRPKSLRVTGNIQSGDAIVLLASSGVQTNGLSLCRKLAMKLEDGYLTPLSKAGSSNGSAAKQTYGDALLAPSIIYAGFVRALQAKGVQPSYLAHITGHGWRKIMRADVPLVYRMTNLGTVPPVFDFIARHGPVDTREMYGTFNMGAGFAAYVKPADVSATLEAAQAAGVHAWLAGHAHHEGGRKAVVLEPLGISYEADTLAVK